MISKLLFSSKLTSPVTYILLSIVTAESPINANGRMELVRVFH